ncbi:MAG: hypothetical protein ACPHO6_04190 [Candidatus Latescibacterota bacterium]
MSELIEICCIYGGDHNLVRVDEDCGSIGLEIRNCGNPDFSDVPDFMLGMTIYEAKTLRNSLNRHINKAIRYQKARQQEEEA